MKILRNLPGIFLALLAPVTLQAGVAVLVYGGTPAGVMAAVEAARMGKSVTLLAPEKHVGGIMVNGLGSGDINNHWFQNDEALGGLSLEFYQRAGRKYGAPGPVYRYESHVAEAVFEDLLREAHVPVVRAHRLREPLSSSVEWQPGTKALRAVVTESGERFEAQAFVDATIEGDLLAAAGVETTLGRESAAQYGESKAGIRAETTHGQFRIFVDPYVVPGDPHSGLLPTIQEEALGTPGAADRSLQAYCFRLCLTKDPENRMAIEKPEGFDRKQYEIYFRYLRAGGKLWTPRAILPHGKTDLLGGHDLSINLYGMNRDYPNGSYATREKIVREHLAFTQGLVWLLGNDPEIPEATRAAWHDWGLTRDEFTDNGGWPQQLYIRDARRMVSDFVTTQQHTLRVNPVPIPDPVAVAIWPTDLHSVRRIVRNGAAYNEGAVFDDDNWGPFGIAYRALVPRRSEATNLITPTCVSSSHVAYGAIRLEQTFMALGQAAATAAVLAVEHRTAMQDVDYAELRKRLVSEGQVVSVSIVAPKGGVRKDP